MVFPWLMIILGAVFRVAEAASLPIVDLGYELHQANSFSLRQHSICCSTFGPTSLSATRTTHDKSIRNPDRRRRESMPPGRHASVGTGPAYSLPEEPEPVPEKFPAEGEFEQWAIPQVPPDTEGGPSASLSHSDTSNHEKLPKAPYQTQAQGHIARISCADLMLYQNWESLSSKYKKKRDIKLA
ncbi:hypothetical protein M752DRAFT_265537 [Aspergillus phoenicis ATCC 13157]|uniref:Uncharacterized protein n=1 Tax=Aspergillus phoenicis ATCC 13157 TaxID=1353007 RepID=A0A370PKC0_ASPPH|nr:hypothetical protein M752DRAFT_265537 [Aspergillus phoenicis ATCC 13157]